MNFKVRIFMFLILTCLVSIFLYNVEIGSFLLKDSKSIQDKTTTKTKTTNHDHNENVNYNREEVCECRKSSKVKFLKIERERFSIFLGDDPKTRYEVSLKQLNRSTCDLHNTLRRPIGQKLYSVSLYGKASRYYQLLKYLSQRIKNVYPGWILRIYHDRSIKPEKKCEIECLKDLYGNFYDNVDFCDVENIPRLPTNYDASVESSSQLLSLFTWSFNATYIHASMWRYIAIGDLLVDAFLSRDLDMEIFDREIGAVNEWLDSSYSGHIMRDHPLHSAELMAGMWGFYNSRNYLTADTIYNNLIHSNISFHFNKNNEFGQDQKFPAEYIYPLIVSDTLVHDSYFCTSKKNEITRPFPVQRSGACWIGFWYSPELQCLNGNATQFICPVDCRPKEHPDWTTC